jgi:carbamoyl-phosphate synthase large subunit
MHATSSQGVNTRKILITGAGGAGTQEILRALNSDPRNEVVCADAYGFAAGFSLVKKSYTIPFGADPNFSNVLLAILQKERPGVVVPLVDEEIPKFHELAAQHFPEMKVISPNPVFCDLSMDKWAMANAMSQAGLGHAKTWLASDVAKCVFPAIIKPRTGRGSRGFALVDTSADVARYLAATSVDAEQFILQERLMGDEYTTSVVVTLDNNLLAIVPKQVVEKRGITRVGVTRNVAAIDALCLGIHSQLSPGGPFNVQLILDRHGVPHVFEVNPRYSTTTALTIAAGVDEVGLVVRSAFGDDVRSGQFKTGMMMVRYETQLFVDESAWKPTAVSEL